MGLSMEEKKPVACYVFECDVILLQDEGIDHTKFF